MVYYDIDAAVRAMENDDYPDGEAKYTECPVCGYRTNYTFFETLFKNERGEIIGCNNCIFPVDENGRDMRGSYR